MEEGRGQWTRWNLCVKKQYVRILVAPGQGPTVSGGLFPIMTLCDFTRRPPCWATVGAGLDESLVWLRTFLMILLGMRVGNGISTYRGSISQSTSQGSRSSSCPAWWFPGNIWLGHCVKPNSGLDEPDSVWSIRAFLPGTGSRTTWLFYFIIYDFDFYLTFQHDTQVDTQGGLP